MHLEDGQLVSLLDQPASHEANAHQHLSTCAHCQSRLDTIRQASAELSTVLRSFPTPIVPQRLRPSHGARRNGNSAVHSRAYPMMAAATILLLASAAFAAPIRQWIARALSPAPSPTTGGKRDAQPARPAAEPTAGAMTVSFAPLDTLLVVTVASRQATGTLELARGEQPSVSVTITKGGQSEEFLVARGSLQIKNSESSRADYRITVPAQVTGIRLRIGDAAVQTVTVGPSTPASIALTGGGPRKF
jgi:hypothetical protein